MYWLAIADQQVPQANFKMTVLLQSSSNSLIQ